VLDAEILAKCWQNFVLVDSVMSAMLLLSYNTCETLRDFQHYVVVSLFACVYNCVSTFIAVIKLELK